MASANMNPTIIEDYMQKEKEAGRLLGPFTGETTPTVHINRIGVIPKKRQPNKWRLITDLSHPESSSVNDAISKDQCTLSYITVDEVATAAMALGAGALLAKIDIQAAYRLVPVHPGDRHWLGIRWNDRVYVDSMLPFGLRSAPKIFTAVADALEWCISRRSGQSVPLSG